MSFREVSGEGLFMGQVLIQFELNAILAIIEMLCGRKEETQTIGGGNRNMIAIKITCGYQRVLDTKHSPGFQ